MRQSIYTDKAPPCLGTYSQAIKVNNMVFLSGQIPLDPKTNELVGTDIQTQITQVFENLKTVAEAAGGSLDAIVRVSVYLIDLSHFPSVNETMSHYFKQPYPARTTIGISALPKGSLVEVDAIMMCDG